MNLKSYLRSGSAAAIAAALSFGALPSIAHADDDNGRHRGREARSQSQQAGQANAAQTPVVTRDERPYRAAPQHRAYQAPVPQQRSYQAPVAQERSTRSWNQSERRSATATTRSGREWNRGDAGQARAQAQSQARAQAQVEAQASARRSGQWSGQRSGDASTRTAGSWDRNRTYSTGDRNQTYRDGSRTTSYRDGNRTTSYRDGDRTSSYRDGARTSSYRDGSRTSNYRDGDHRTWSRDWRRDNRYNWSSYRTSNRNIYHLGRYYSPYSNYRYSRLSIGFSLNSLFYGSRYWINDPWQYRLPEAYGPYRWVRYYDDALLVDIYSGQVVDVIYDFFW